MIREIKFRGWHTRLKKMFSSEEMGMDQLTIMPDGRGFINVSGADTSLSQFITDMIPMQYTGFKDDNGKDIYEFDIKRDEVAQDDGDLRLHFVCVWVKEWGMFSWLSVEHGEYRDYQLKGVDSLDSSMFWSYPMQDSEQTCICGNVFVHPDYIKL